MPHIALVAFQLLSSGGRVGDGKLGRSDLDTQGTLLKTPQVAKWKNHQRGGGK